MKDAAYCLYCYLFQPDIGQQGGGDSFVIEGFRNWKKKEEEEEEEGEITESCWGSQQRT